jgi:Protein of unknown function (DUF1688)
VTGAGTPPDASRADGAAAILRTTAAIRARAEGLLARARRHESSWFSVDSGALQTTATLVSEVTHARYPDLDIPYHSRWRHFEAGQVARKTQLDHALGQAGIHDVAEVARIRIELALVSVLLDAGAGPDWRYQEAASGQTLTRSEGLGVASFHAFMAGLFSGEPAQPFRADAQGLRAVTAQSLAAAFQVGPRNPLVGLEGRVQLLQRLGNALALHPAVFGPTARVGGLYDHLLTATTYGPPIVHAHDLLSALLTTLGTVWPAPNAIGDISLGDCWQHTAVPGVGLTAGWMPFHKLSQWLAYSLLEPLVWAGVKITGLNTLTGLPEYRNGGLMLDAGVLRLKDPAVATATWRVGDEMVVEWRALTVALLDELAPLVREQLGLSEARMPLACVLEGGTWAAGRVLAQRLRDGSPPLNIQSDGTVF